MAKSNGTFTVYSKSSLSALREYPLPVTNSWTREISPDGRHLACWCDDGRVRVFETKRLTQTSAFETQENGQLALAFSPDGRVLAGCASKRMWAWDLESQTEIMRDDMKPFGGVLAVAFSLDGRWVACSEWGSSTAVV